MSTVSQTVPAEIVGLRPAGRSRHAADDAPTVTLTVQRPMALPSTDRQVLVDPGLLVLPVVATIVLVVSVWLSAMDGERGVLSWVTSVLWTLPTYQSALGVVGAFRARRAARRAASLPLPEPVLTDRLVVVIPTVGRLDTLGALERVVPSFCTHLAPWFPRLRVDVVVDEGSAGQARIAALAASLPGVRMLIVPRHYATPRGTRFKARANHYAHEVRMAAGEDRDDVWVLHMDDDTAVGPDTGREIARFVHEQRNRPAAEQRHLAQGVLAYPAENAAHRGTWLADAVRPTSDLSVFAATTGAGTPRAGVHGELLLVRASIEACIGWDFGPRAMVEDAEFALRFGRMHPGRSGWFAGRSLGAAPVSLEDFLRQRERWAWGLLELVFRRDIALRHRLLLGHNVLIWAMGPLQHVVVVLAAGALLGDVDTLPVTGVLLPLWALNTAYQVWSYWEGHRVNARASLLPRPWYERFLVILAIPLFSLWEAAGVLRGVVRFVRGGESSFTVIAKPL